MHATELYHVPLRKPEYVVADFKIPLRKGLLSTVTDLERLLKSTKSSITRELGKAFQLKSSNIEKIRRVVVAAAQLEWYQAKGTTPPQSVIDTYNNRIAEANVEEQTTSAPETTTSGESITATIEAGESITATIEAGKVRAGTRPYCKSLILAGERDEQKLLEAVHEKFPDKTSVFKVGDVRGCLRNAGVLAWTGRKGAKKAAADAT